MSFRCLKLAALLLRFIICGLDLASGGAVCQRLRRRPNTTIALGMLAVVVLSSFTSVSAQVFDQREQDLVSGLRDRGLFDLAELHCTSLLDRNGLTPTDHAAIAIERIRIKSGTARSGSSREQQWAEVDRIAEEFSSAHPDNPRAVLVGLQQALAHMSFAKLLQQEVAAKSSVQQGRELGIKELRKARSILDRTRRDAMELVKMAANVQPSEHLLTAKQLRTLITNFDYQLAVVNLTSAQLANGESETDRLDRVDSLGRVLKQLASVRAAVASSRPLWWQTWINEVSCRRMMGDLSAADKILATVKKGKRPKSTDEMLLLEEIEMAIAIGNELRMKTLASKATAQRHSAEVEVALIKLLVAAGQIERASALSSRVSSSAGAYWARRADVALLSGGTPERNATVDDAETRMLLQAAEKAQKSGNLDAALKGYLSVAKAQFSSGQSVAGLSSIARAGKVLEGQGKHGEAAGVYLEPAKTHRTEQSASSIHLRGCWNLSKAKSETFAKELEIHIRSWPKSETANQARYWLGTQQVRTKDYGDAFDVLTGVSPASSHFAAAVRWARIASRLELQKVEARKAATNPLAKRMHRSWDDVFNSCTDSAKPLVALAMAELGMCWRAEDSDKVLLRMESVANLPTAKTNPEFLYWFALAGGPLEKVDLANELPFDEAMVRQVLTSAQQIKSSKRLAEVRLKIADDALTDSKNVKAKGQFQLAKATALVDLGKKKDAVALFQNQLRANPKDLSAKLGLARILTGKEALKLWRAIASRTAPQSDAWFEAKFNVANLLFESGNRSEAAKMLKYIKAVPPGWENSTLKSQFESLLRKADR